MFGAEDDVEEEIGEGVCHGGGIVPREKEPAAPTGLGMREMPVLSWGRRSFVATFLEPLRGTPSSSKLAGSQEHRANARPRRGQKIVARGQSDEGAAAPGRNPPKPSTAPEGRQTLGLNRADTARRIRSHISGARR